ncbi:alternative ribosome rescue aminoacyl-tRNA hydrolase ArfB [Roseimaritima ulvae]|uniref:Peptidyl-tRNA hydrolase ArfB n=1 Tax=Roseimaritima ulvae TaxID=980254 RepID=A0A5B9QLP8_9BACT|nr:alternative ribosome rescue aminoacyl-tRNA hydrolase ArfB [Roseimaritima ulvae]QEG39938.1 Peptidyl-tRNA hydrolase ArfB [Roseimaritima ulvae]
MDNLVINRRLTIPASQLSVSFARSSGPGGQNVNKVNSKVTLRWQIRDQPLISRAWRERFLQRFGTRVNVRGELVVSSERYRDQPRNLEDCREKLAEMLRQVASAPQIRKKTKPTLGSKRRRLDAKKRQSQKKRLRGRPTMD